MPLCPIKEQFQLIKAPETPIPASKLSSSFKGAQTNSPMSLETLQLRSLHSFRPHRCTSSLSLPTRTAPQEKTDLQLERSEQSRSERDLHHCGAKRWQRNCKTSNSTSHRLDARSFLKAQGCSDLALQQLQEIQHRSNARTQLTGETRQKKR